MCRPAAFILGTRPLWRPGEAPGTGDVPRWSSAGREESLRGFPFGGIWAAPALARFPGRRPGSLVARSRALFQRVSRQQVRWWAVLGVQPVPEKKKRAPVLR
ncbi:hypothetical protein NDU88_003789 [Pleurodeles waltl]|uniref:Uncharacterized protein n=1 Tax=Pleurodeles waltl TaxID=8319 RepID=A0AAV7W740_PLEWA|nr:hypothetical protein NDU88_003789 [Pleurodeles waltl]